MLGDSWTTAMRWALCCALSSALVGCSARQAPRRGEVMVALSTDMSVPKDVTLLRVKIKVGTEVRYEYDFKVAPDGEFHLPGTVAVVEGSKPAEVVQVEVVGIRNLKAKPEARVFAKITTTVPRERIALLRVPIQWLCDKTAVDDGSEEYLSTCAPENGDETSCVAGTCVSTSVAEQALPSYVPAQVYGGGNSASDPLARCFDVTACFAEAQALEPDADCTLSLPDDGKPLNFALQPAANDGICDPQDRLAPCFVPLDQVEGWGWTLRTTPPPPAGKRVVQFPPGVCQALKTGRASALRRSLRCETKTPMFPTCGPWSEIRPTGSGANAADAGSGGSGGVGAGQGTAGASTGSGGLAASSAGAGASVSGGTSQGGSPDRTGGKGGASGGAGGAGATSGGGSGGALLNAEAITLPFDSTRTISAASSPALFSFQGSAFRITSISIGDESRQLSGSYRLLKGATVLATGSSSDLAPQLYLSLPSDGTYTIEIKVTLPAVASVHLQVALGPLSDKAIAIPSEQQVNAGGSVVGRYTFTTTTPRAVEVFISPPPSTLIGGKARLMQGVTILAEQLLGVNGRALFDPLLRVPGSYTIELRNGVPGLFDLSVKSLPWGALTQEAIVTTPQGSQSMSLADVQFDANGAAVVGYADRDALAGNRFLFKRAVNGSWVDASAPLPLASPTTCVAFALGSTGLPTAVALDASNTPVVRRWEGANWVAVGPNGGAIPVPAADGYTNLGDCRVGRKIRIGADGRPVLLLIHELTHQLLVQRFDGTSWEPLGGLGSVGVPPVFNGFTLGLDNLDRPVVVWKTLNTASFSVSRYESSPAPGWVAVGGNGDPLPTTATTSLMDAPDIAFDANGNPLIAFGLFQGGVSVYQLLDSIWTASAPQLVSAPTHQQTPTWPKLTLDAGGKAVVAWMEPGAVRPYVQRWTGSVWQGLGGSNGLMPNRLWGAYDLTSTSFTGLGLATSPNGELTLAISTNVPSLQAYGFIEAP